MGLINDYQERGRAVGWSATRGGSRRLVVLSDTGRKWCQIAFDQTPVRAEILVALQRHQSLGHAIGVLEARDHLRSAGYGVNDVPVAVLATTRERWGFRTEPDLLVEMDGQLWPVEVQREVSERTLAKWEKALALLGRLALILFNEEGLASESDLLQGHLPGRPGWSGEVRLASLESMQRGDWHWSTVTIGQGGTGRPD